jgi:hypothetical protein
MLRVGEWNKGIIWLGAQREKEEEENLSLTSFSLLAS